MAQQLWGSICLSDIPADKIKVSEKNGKKYLTIKVWVNDKVDQYGNIASIQVSGSKDETKVYIGNMKESEFKQQETTVSNKGNDLPF